MCQPSSLAFLAALSSGLQHFSKGCLEASNLCLGMSQLVITKGLGSHPGPSVGCFVPGVLPVESDMQLVFLYAACTDIFPRRVSVDIPSSSIQVSSHLLMCSWRAPLLCHLPSLLRCRHGGRCCRSCRSCRPHQSLSLGRWAVGSRRSCSSMVAVTLVPALPGGSGVCPGRVPRQGALGRGQPPPQPEGPLPAETWRDAAWGTTQPA